MTAPTAQTVPTAGTIPIPAQAVLDSWALKGVTQRDAALFDRAGMVPADWPSWRLIETAGPPKQYQPNGTPMPAYRVASLFETGMSVDQAREWAATVENLPNNLQRFVDAGWTGADYVAFQDAVEETTPSDLDMNGYFRRHYALLDEWVMSGHSAHVAIAHVRAGGSVAEVGSIDHATLTLMEGLRR